ncbi:MAG: ABC transporter substrate-binding protein [Coriobacteriia bacterium]|nr:ABC transporter substrate-binding protein [Coriobacteriia bacterium]
MTGKWLQRMLPATVVLTLVVASLAGCSQADSSSDEGGEETAKEPYTIGAVLSLSGTYAGLGEPEKNTIEMELERINEDGGVNGHPVKVVIEDDATDPAKAQAATVRLIEQVDVLAIIGATGTGQTMGMRGDIDRAGIPQVSVAGGTVVTAQFDPLVFQTPWSNSLVVPFTLSRLRDAGITKIALMYDTGGFGADGGDVVKATVGEYGISVVAEQTFNPGDTDMTAQLTMVKGSDAEAVVLWNAGKESAIVAKNMQQLSMMLPLYGCHGNARAEFAEGAGDAAEGFRFAAGKILLPETYGTDSMSYRVATDFVERYTERYGKAPDTFAGHAYDALYLIVEAMRRLPEGFTTAELRDEIERTDDFVGIGGIFTFTESDHNGMSEDDLVMYRIQDGAWVLDTP